MSNTGRRISYVQDENLRALQTLYRGILVAYEYEFGSASPKLSRQWGAD